MVRWPRSCRPPRKNKKLVVAVAAADGAVQPGLHHQALFGTAVADALLYHRVQRRIAHDAALAHLAGLQFELGLDQHQQVAARRQQRHQRGQHQRERDERQVARHHIKHRRNVHIGALGAASYDYLFYSGYVVLAYWWAHAVAATKASAQDAAFKQAKLETARFYYARVLPRTLAHAACIQAGAEPLMAMEDARFGA